MDNWLKILEAHTDSLFQVCHNMSLDRVKSFTIEETERLDDVSDELELIVARMKKILNKVGTWE